MELPAKEHREQSFLNGDIEKAEPEHRAKRYERLLKAYSTLEGVCQDADHDDDDDEVPMASSAYKRKATDDHPEARSAKKNASNVLFRGTPTARLSNSTRIDPNRAPSKGQTSQVEQGRAAQSSPRLPFSPSVRPPASGPLHQRTMHAMPPAPPAPAHAAAPALVGPMPRPPFPAPFASPVPGFTVPNFKVPLPLGPIFHGYFPPEGPVAGPPLPKGVVMGYQEASLMMGQEDWSAQSPSDEPGGFKPIIGQYYPIRVKPLPTLEADKAVNHESKLPPQPQEVQPAPQEPKAENTDLSSGVVVVE